MLTVIGQTAEQIDQLREVVEQGATRSAETEARIGELARGPRPAQKPAQSTTRSWSASPPGRSGWRSSSPRSRGPTAHDRALLERIAQAQERMVAALGAREEDGGGGIDAETRARLRSIDTQVLRILEDPVRRAAGSR